MILRYSKEERIEMGRIIHESGLSNLYAGLYLGIGEETARNYRILYERSKGIRHKSNRKKEEAIDEIKAAEELENSITDEAKSRRCSSEKERRKKCLRKY